MMIASWREAFKSRLDRPLATPPTRPTERADGGRGATAFQGLRGRHTDTVAATINEDKLAKWVR